MFGEGASRGERAQEPMTADMAFISRVSLAEGSLCAPLLRGLADHTSYRALSASSAHAAKFAPQSALSYDAQLASRVDDPPDCTRVSRSDRDVLDTKRMTLR